MKNDSGFSALVLVIIIGISSLIMAEGSTWLGLREVDMGLDSSMGKRAYYSAEACVQDALLRIRNNAAPASKQTIELDGCGCDYVSTQTGAAFAIDANGTCDDHTISLRVSAAEENGLQIKSWTYN